jgi:MoaA/NifB/PqqE/SkfB family radical SAM enzyme
MDRELARTYAKNLMINNKWKAHIARFDREAEEKGYFPSATFELTAFCTLSCPMCFVRIDKKQAEAMGGRLRSAEEWIDMAKQFRDQGGLFLLLTGGEPMMRPDFPEIYEELSKMGLFITLFTNATTVDDRMLSVLKKRPPAMVGMTLYGSSEETYRKFGGSENSFQKVLDGFDRLLTIPNLPIEVKFNACSENYRDFKGVYELAARRKKLISLDFGECAPVRGACSRARELRLTGEQHKEVREILRDISGPMKEAYQELYKTRVPEDNEVRSGEKPESAGERHLTCRGGKISVYITGDGKMVPCDMAAFPYAFPFEQGFRAAADDIRKQVSSLLLPERCLNCANRETICTCIPKALNEMADCARAGKKCSYIPKDVPFLQ